MEKCEDFLSLDPARGAILEVDESDSSIRLYLPVFSCDVTDDNEHAEPRQIDTICINIDPENTGFLQSVVNPDAHSDKRGVSNVASLLGVKSPSEV